MDILRSLAPPAYWDRLCIAGGYAACPPLAWDVDVWVLGVEPGSKAQAELVEHLMGKRLIEDGALWASYPGTDFEVLKPSVSWGPTGMDVQIIITERPTIPCLLASFDLGPHQVAISMSGYVETGPLWQGLEVVTCNPMAVKSERHLQLTLGRAQKLKYRYRGNYILQGFYEAGALYGWDEPQVRAGLEVEEMDLRTANASLGTYSLVM